MTRGLKISPIVILTMVVNGSVRIDGKNETDDRFHRRVELALRSYFQIQIIVAFEELARDWGILDSCDQAANSKAKSDVYTGFDRLTSYMASDRIPWLRTRNPLSRIRAQHHGINTPMLDFTSSYFVALDFASRGSHECSGSHLAVWAIVDSPPLDFSHPYSVVSTYLQTQRSFMLFNSSADKAFYECGQWIPFETRLSNTMPLGSVFKVTLPFSEVESLVKWLRLTTSPLYMMGTPMYESVLSMQRRVDCLKTKFCDEVRRRVQCQIDWDQVQIDIRHQSQAQAQEATFCETRCNDHCNTMFSTTFK